VSHTTRSGKLRDCRDWADTATGCKELHVNAGGRSFTFRQTYGAGARLEPGILEVMDVVFDSVELDAWPTVTPLPAVRSEIGDGPFVPIERAKQQALDMIVATTGLAQSGWTAAARLVSEAEALALGRCDMNRDDADWYPYPEAVWAVELTGPDGVVYDTYLDAGDIYHICTAQRGQPTDSDGGPYPALGVPRPPR
jgi:hypothetical protein